MSVRAISFDILTLPDHTIAAKAQLAKLSHPNHPKISNGGFDDGRLIIDWRHVRLAADRLKVRWLVTIGWMSINDEPDSFGRYIGSTDHAHTIRLRRGCSATDCSATLAHELVHAAQREAPGFTSFEARRESYEREACALSQTLNDLALVRERQR